jgi:hypothetical protein
MIALSITLLIDISFVKINDLVNKYFIPMGGKLTLFSVNSSICLVLQFLVIKFAKNSIERRQFSINTKLRVFYMISLVTIFVLAVLVGLLMFEQFYFKYYQTMINILIITTSYGTSAIMITWLALLFLYWFKSSRDLVVLLYFVSMCLISFNLIVTLLYVDAKLTDNQYLVGEYVGSSGDVSGGSHPFLNSLFRISSLVSFFSIWMTTAILMNSYREKLIRSVMYWTILVLPLIYFIITYFYQFTLSPLLFSYFQKDPLTVSIVVSAILTLSKPIGGLLFAISFWNMSKIIGYEKRMRLSMAIAGWGIFFIFSANQAATQIVVPYPPFGIATVTILNMASFLLLIGIFNSATLVSANNNLRIFIHKQALKLLNPIGEAKMAKEVQKAVMKISKDMESSNISREETFEFDQEELEKYLNDVIRIKKEQKR